MTYSPDHPVRNQRQKFKAQDLQTFSILKIIKLRSNSSSLCHFNKHLQYTKQQITATFPILKISRLIETVCLFVWTAHRKMIHSISVRWTYHYRSNLHLIHSLLRKSDLRKYIFKHNAQKYLILCFVYVTVSYLIQWPNSRNKCESWCSSSNNSSRWWLWWLSNNSNQTWWCSSSNNSLITTSLSCNNLCKANKWCRQPTCKLSTPLHSNNLQLSLQHRDHPCLCTCDIKVKINSSTLWILSQTYEKCDCSNER